MNRDNASAVRVELSSDDSKPDSHVDNMKSADKEWQSEKKDPTLKIKLVTKTPSGTIGAKVVQMKLKGSDQMNIRNANIEAVQPNGDKTPVSSKYTV